jgi:hypothetical protein
MKLRATLFTALGILLIAAGAVAFFWLRTIPYRSNYSRAFVAQTDFVPVPVDAQIKRMIACAQLDFLLSPTQGGRTILHFSSAQQNSTGLYLFFTSNWSHTAIVYTYDRATRKPQWKTEIDTDPDR